MTIDKLKEIRPLRGQFKDIVPLDELKEFAIENVINKLMLLRKMSSVSFLIRGEMKSTEFVQGYERGLKDAIKGVIHEFQLTLVLAAKLKEKKEKALA